MPVKVKKGFLTPYKSYMFKKKDPIIDTMRTVVEDSGLSYKDIHESSGVSTTAMYNWFHGGTRRPQFCTIAAVASACGKQLVMADKKHR